MVSPVLQPAKSSNAPETVVYLRTPEIVPLCEGSKVYSFKASEVKFVSLMAVILCLVTTLPYAVAYYQTIQGTTFSGLIEHSLDSNNYLAYENQSAFGRWLFRNPMTSEPHKPVFFNLEWLVIGKLAAIVHVPASEATGILRLLCLVLMCFSVYWLSTFVLESEPARRIALVAIMSGGGFGWVVAVHLLHFPLDSAYFIDLTNANLFPFYWALKLPHFLISESLIVLGLCFYLRAEQNVLIRYYAFAGLCFLTAGMCRPYDMLFAMAATVLYACFHHEHRSRLSARCVPALMCVPLLGYYLWIFKIHPVFRWWSLPGNPAPSPWLLALGFGMSFPLLVAGWRLRDRKVRRSEQFLLTCLLTAAVFAYSHLLFHFSFQFATNILAPMVLVGIAWMELRIAGWLQRGKWTRILVLALLCTNSLTSIALTGQAIVLAKKGDFRVNTKLLEAFRWLDGHSAPNDIVLADFDLASQVPDYTHNVVFCGYANAVDVQHKLGVLAEFLDPRTSPKLREGFIRRIAPKFILLSPAEEESLHLADMQVLTQVFKNDSAVILFVNNAQLGSMQ